MTRTQVQLPDALFARVRRFAESRESSLAEVCRNAPRTLHKKGATRFRPPILPSFWGPKAAKTSQDFNNGQESKPKKNPSKSWEKKMVGATRFELVTFCTPSKRATSLRYAPTGIHANLGWVYHALPAQSIPLPHFFLAS